MGGGASQISDTTGVLSDQLTRKPNDASDINSLEDAKAEITALREALLNATPENHPSKVKAKIISDRKQFEEMFSKVPTTFEAKTYPLGCIADQDENSKVAEDGNQIWETFLLIGNITSKPTEDGKGVTYEVDAPEKFAEHRLVTDRGDKRNRGAEYSLLHWFDGKLVTACDRTGNIDEIAKCTEGPDTYELKPVNCTVEGEEKPLVLLKGDGTKNKALKCEWSAIKDGKLWVGSTGKERTNDDGSVSGQGEMWVKTIDPASWVPTHVDWIDNYNALRKVAQCEFGKGYFVNECGEWSDVHKRWFFMPRKLSREYYDEIKDCEKCCNLMISCDADFSPESIILQDVLSFSTLRGTADLKFVPGTNDTHICLVRTEETLDNVVSSYLSIVDITGKVLMDEVKIATGRKIEGIEFVQSFLDSI